jgi:hypothetical protein
MRRHAFSAHPHNNNNVGLHTFVHGEKLDLNLHQNLKKENLAPQEMWENNNV